MALFARTGRFVVRGSSCGFTGLPWNRRFDQAPSLTANFEFCYSTKSGKAKTRSKSKAKKLESKPAMDDEKNAFFVVRKGDLVGVYKTFSDCQAQVGSSIFDPPISIFKGYTMSKETEDYMRSCGLRNALYSVRAADLKEELFGTLVPCPLQEPPAFNGETAGRSCNLEFDGSSKGNPGKAGAGAVLRTDDGSLICKLREGLGIATCNVAEYRALILGLRYALNKGFTTIRVQGDSKLVCMQVQGLWKVKSENISRWCEEAIKLKDGFLSFHINHVLRMVKSTRCYEMLLRLFQSSHFQRTLIESSRISHAPSFLLLKKNVLLVKLISNSIREHVALMS